jgi:hypothetical protein
MWEQISNHKEIECGVRQGSILGSLLFYAMLMACRLVLMTTAS